VTHRSPPAPTTPLPGRYLAALAALAFLLLAACVPGVSTPTPAAPAGRPPPVSEKVLQQAPNVPSPPSGPIPGASPANPGAAGGYPVPGPGTTPITRPAPGAAYP
jgi:hypothetical protein